MPSFVIEANGVRLLTALWTHGRVFNNSWDLVAFTVFNDYDSIDYIWLSHEHPDHFSPPVLAAIPKESRNTITVLFQETSDQRVVGFSEKLGFRVRELPDGTRSRLSDDFHLTLGKVPFYDSWLLIEAAGALILNLNDCVLSTPAIMKALARKVGHIDVILCQFSFASWHGSANQVESWKSAAREKLDHISKQIAVFRPNQVIPCASFMRFCHTENSFMNAFANRVSKQRWISKTSNCVFSGFTEQHRTTLWFWPP